VVGVKISNTLTFFRKKFSLALYLVEMDPDQQARDARSGSAKMIPIRPDPHTEFETAWQCEIYSAVILGEKLETNYLPD
jgi:hypothetical protein